MSDWSAQHSGVSSALAGLDMTMPGDEGFDSGNSYWGSNLTIAVLNGTVPQWRLDDMCIRIMAAWYYVGRDQNQVENAPNFSAWTTNTSGYQHQYAMEGYTQVNYHVVSAQCPVQYPLQYRLQYPKALSTLYEAADCRIECPRKPWPAHS